MARTRRNRAPNAVHHIVNRANRRKPIFRKAADYKAFVSILEEAVARFSVRLIAFCVMPNHWHLVVWSDEKVSISAFMHWVTSTHVRRYHLHYGLTGTGHLYQAPYRNHVCHDDRGVLAVMRYMEGNPVDAGLVRRAQSWEWSSLRLRVTGEEAAGWVAPPPTPLPENWTAYVNENTPSPRRGKAPAENSKRAIRAEPSSEAAGG